MAVVIGTRGADTLTGAEDEADYLKGQDGGDLLHGLAKGDDLNAGPGDDTLAGGDGPDMLRGGPGSDRLLGGGAADVLTGHKGDDVLDGGAGNDVLFGGAGADTFVLRSTPGSSVDLVPDFDTAEGDQLRLRPDGITVRERDVDGDGDRDLIVTLNTSDPAVGGDRMVILNITSAELFG